MHSRALRTTAGVLLLCLLEALRAGSAAAETQHCEASPPTRKIQSFCQFQRADSSVGPRLIDVIAAKKLGTRLPIGQNLTGTCGHESQLIASFRDPQNILKLDLRDGSQLQLYPLYINDKEGGNGWNCYRVNVRNACVTRAEARNGGYRIHFTVHQNSEANDYEDAADAVDIKPDGSIDYSASKSSKFYLLKSAPKLVEALDEAFSGFRCRDGEDTKQCYTAAHFSGQWKVLEKLRIHMRAQTATAKPVWQADHAQTDAYLIASGFKRNSWIWSYHLKLRENESGVLSPFELWDAVLHNSGPSFGIHQIDLGANPEGDRQFFRKLMSSAGLPAQDPLLGGYLNQKCFEKPLRWIRVRDWRVYTSRLPLINATLRQNSVKDTILGHYAKYLSGVEAEVQELPEDARSKYPNLVMLIPDVDNQFGKTAADTVKESILKSHAEAASPRETGCRVLGILLATDYGKKNPKGVRSRFEQTTELTCS